MKVLSRSPGLPFGKRSIGHYVMYVVVAKQGKVEQNKKEAI
jgi:hypothetical protein